MKIFPTPAKEEVTIRTELNEGDYIHIIDVSGKLVGLYKILNQEAKVNICTFTQGIYFCEIHDKKDKILTKGKFNVVK